MSQSTAIEWTDATWNPTRGCSRVSEGCRNCYAEKQAYRYSGPGMPYEGLVRIGADGKRRAEWNGQIHFAENKLLEPTWWKAPRRIFVNSMSDLFHGGVTDEQLDRIFAVMALCPQHTFQVLTKRPERMLAYLSGAGVESRVAHACVTDGSPLGDGFFSRTGSLDLVELYWKNCVLFYAEDDTEVEPWDAYNWKAADFQWPLRNVWLGVSVEDQPTADARIPLLLQTPAAVRFISAEPLLGPMDLHNLDAHKLLLAQGYEPREEELQDPWKYDALTEGEIYWGGPGGISDGPEHTALDWVIVGGESGPGARPMHPDWARSLRDQCVAAGVPFFFKQWGEWVHAVGGARLYDEPDKYVALDGRVGSEKEALAGGKWQGVWRVGKKAAGNLLDGKVWQQFPEVAR